MTWDAGRGSRQDRGYGAEWDRLRIRILERDEYLCRCAECKRTGRLRNATEVDHIKPKAQGGTDDPSNLCAINKDCHKRKTHAEMGRPLRERAMIGVDGHPIEKRTA